MTKDDIIRMAKEAGLLRSGDGWTEPHRWGATEVERFAELVAEASASVEREAFQTKCKQYAAWMNEAAGDIEDWGMYASDYLQEKYDLAGQVLEYKIRADTIRDMK